MNTVQRFGLLGILSGLVSMGVPSLSSPVQAQTPAPLLTPPPPAGTTQAAPATGGLTTAQVAERLMMIPVFTIASQEGLPVTTVFTDGNGQNVQQVNFWMSKEQADTVFTQLQQENPEVASQSQVVPYPLGEAYQLFEANDPQTEGLTFRVFPRESDVQTALQVLQANGLTEITEFPGIPLFFGSSDQGMLVIERDGVEIVPFFFDHQDLKTTLERANQDNPGVVQSTQIEVTDLTQVLALMKNPQGDGNVSKIAFVPAKAAFATAQSMAAQFAQPQAAPTP